ncbi:MAG: HAD-IB family hydrolase, partial [Sphingobacteriales bacterium]
RELAMHKQNGTKVVVVSASAENWVKPFCEEHQLICMGTKLEVDANGLLTGKLTGVNCNAAEKVNRIKCEFDPADFENIYAYGDSNGDKEMLAIATHPHYRFFTD